MLVGIFSKIPYLTFTWRLLPIGILSLCANTLIIYVLFRKEVGLERLNPIALEKPPLDLMLTVKSLGVLFLIFLGFVFTGNLPLSAITGSLALTIISV